MGNAELNWRWIQQSVWYGIVEFNVPLDTAE